MNQRRAAWLFSAAALCLWSGAANGQVIETQDFETANLGGWLCNGNEELYFDNTSPNGWYIGIPFSDFWGVTLRNDTPGRPMVGDLTVYPSFTFKVDFRVFNLQNWFEEPMDPANFNLTLEFVDYDSYASVYFVGPPLPQIGQPWTTYEFTIPDTSQAALPPGWGGTGDEDPVTFEPRLPPGRTWQNVLASVDEVRVTTMKPGWFYSANFWQAGFDNVHITLNGGTPTCGTSDFNGDGDFGTDADIEAFFACLGGQCCATCFAGGADFNGDGDTGTDADIEAFFRVLGGGEC